MVDTVWFLDAGVRQVFEQLSGVRHAFFSSTISVIGVEFVYVITLVIAVPAIGSRAVRIAFTGDRPGDPVVTVMEPLADPADRCWSLHRYDDGSLCMWKPDDPPTKRWVHVDGLAALLAYIRTHLVREAWWRETGEWAGEEAPHPQRAEAR